MFCVLCRKCLAERFRLLLVNNDCVLGTGQSVSYRVSTASYHHVAQVCYVKSWSDPGPALWDSLPGEGRGLWVMAGVFW